MIQLPVIVLIAIVAASALGGIALENLLSKIGRADLESQIQRLRWHLSKIIHESRTTTGISAKTLENAKRTLDDPDHI